MTTVTVNAWCAPQKLRMPDDTITVVDPGESLTADFDEAQMREIEASPGHFTIGKPAAAPPKPLPTQHHRQNRRGGRH